MVEPVTIRRRQASLSEIANSLTASVGFSCRRCAEQHQSQKDISSRKSSFLNKAVICSLTCSFAYNIVGGTSSSNHSVVANHFQPDCQPDSSTAMPWETPALGSHVAMGRPIVQLQLVVAWVSTGQSVVEGLLIVQTEVVCLHSVGSDTTSTAW